MQLVISDAMSRLAPAMLAALLVAACSTGSISSGPVEVEGIRVPQQFRDAPERLILVTVANDQSTAPRAGSTPRSYEGSLMYTASSQARKVTVALANDYHVRELSAWPIAPLGVYCVVFEIPENGTRPELLERLSVDKRVKLAQPMQTFGTLTQSYNDPYVRLQRGFQEIHAADAHRWSRGARVRVAVIDTGIDFSHPDLRGRVSSIRNFVDADDAQFKRDRHGTEVAGVIAAVANNREGIVGVAPEVELLVFKACWQLAAGEDGARCDSFTLAQALVAAIDEKAQIVNLSLAGPADPLLAALIAHGLSRGMIFVGAIAPTAMPLSGKIEGFPAGTVGVLAVDAVESHAQRDRTLLAPGREILTLLPGGHYEFASGSSLAVAHVTGAVALLLARDRRLDAKGVESLLSRTSASNATETWHSESINACNALASILRHATCASTEQGSLVVQGTPRLR